jgi:hypothetical protein
MFFEIEQKAQHFKFSEILIDENLGNDDYPSLRKNKSTPKFISLN